jgi:DNA-binding MarR family transcriptional regulator
MEIFGRVYRLAGAGGEAVENAYAKFGIGRAEFDVLATLRRSGAPYELPPSTLAASMMLSSGGTTAQTDRRSVLVRLSDKGREIIDQAVGAGLSEQQRLLRHMEPAKVKRLSALLREALRSS